ncbi:metal-dependent hydrolase family protein [Pseudoruegeria sp. SHC-113]|uniref:metal-dependent hydrolase family protein n=1 Tax=Pseudoruegeria sp. SHC-113 TaxID=2855439 RepID=UPI0021BAFA7C|nr:amidohydrolase family protein [Pseudoruegeria sp. SHC-113]MCT8159071.1 amidohydrolase family protein [Pseudoruegeria sp. SHC-113]
MLTKRTFLSGLLSSAALTVAPATVKAATPDATLFTNVRVFDGTSDALTGLTNVLVEGELIKEISPTADAAPEVPRIDGGGRTLMPGLIDNHVHLQWNQGPMEFMTARPDYVAALALRECEATLMRGFTGVRDTGGGILGVARAIDEGLYPGPRIQACNAAIGMTAGHGDYRPRSVLPRVFGGPAITELEAKQISIIADGVAEVLTATREQFRQGAHFIKVFSGGAVSGLYDPLDINEYSPDELKAAVEEAKRWNTYAASHAYMDSSVRSAIEAGFACIEHCNLMTPDSMELAVEKGVWLSTQVGFFMTDIPEGFSEAQAQRQQMARDGLDAMLRLAKDYGAKIALGTDFVGSSETKATQLNELALRAPWFSNAEILQQATGNNGQLWELAGPRSPYQKGAVGVIVPGAYADILLVNGDPVADLSVMATADNFDVIMKGGRAYKNTLS